MYVVRPVAIADIPALEALAAVASSGVHTMPKTRDAIEHAIEHSIASFAAEVDIPSEESYMFVLESMRDQRIDGIASIMPTVFCAPNAWIISVSAPRNAIANPAATSATATIATERFHTGERACVT